MFVPNLPKWSKPSASKLRHSWVFKKFEPCWFYTFCWESAFYYVRTQAVIPQKCICVSNITDHHFPGWVENLELRTCVHKQRSLLLAKNMFFGKQKFNVKQLKLNKFIFDVKQLNMNRFIKCIKDMIIRFSNATLEVTSQSPWRMWCIVNHLSK